MTCPKLHSSKWLSPPILTALCSVPAVCLPGLDCRLSSFPNRLAPVSLPLCEAFHLPLFHTSGVYPVWFEIKQAKTKAPPLSLPPAMWRKNKNPDFRLILYLVPLEKLLACP